mmetsp:Transcript_9987/g.18191  ORF Transcript_9987/g.18191 Transcript_9987/m.18191 type:complete len:549 (+) Transcript_9987:273-1919(+)|eukprot:CAMPEP_0201673490 /NCGR_PEP_ID=MMETSP0494-20130426/34891_1 /ASSEMBLY_ACC=CAM_ASM_000839 /TAXON_ID=420259 /ORGANISM="Thalassiosira gravida, Strain GMp14c1" /LENGTH=548 /DNA_ID=CAMNT_0048155425 /DNA_START=182 /DNA_END=1828 /DNA_ORIENTATION=-
MADSTSSEDEIMIQCDAPGCGKWFDAIDLTPPLSSQTASQYETWHCEHCIPYHGPSCLRLRRAGLRKRKRINFVKLNDPGFFMASENGHRRDIGLATNDVQDVDFAEMIRVRSGKGVFRSGRSRSGRKGGCLLKLAKGEEFNATYVAKHGFRRPVLFANTKPSQLGLRVPPPRDKEGVPFTYITVAELVGPFRPIQVIDTATQLTTEYTLKEWVEYLETPVKDRTRVLNVITLEFSQTPLGSLVIEPKLARDVDFVNLHWPKTLEDVRKCDGRGHRVAADELPDQLEELKNGRPRVTKYCLMSAAGSYTDFHIDFGGTAVWYHLFSGRKIFYFIEPTPENIKIYSKWATNASGSKTSTYEFLPDLILAAGGEVYEVVLRKGQTLFIPSGWMHAVFTPEDSLVFGGNFVHRHSLEMQLIIYRLERQMKVGMDFRFPNYQKLMWFCAWDFLEECNRLRRRNGNIFFDDRVTDQLKLQIICKTYSPHILKGYKALAKELERWSTSKVKFTTEQYPENMNVLAVSTQLGELMKECVAYVDKEQKEKLRLMRK